MFCCLESYYSVCSGFSPSEEALGMIMNMGFDRMQASKALRATDNNVERALDWIFSHAAELDSANSPPPPPEFRDGNGSKTTHNC